jgi:hypothetical protein
MSRALAALIVLLAGSPAAAQSAWSERVRVGISVGLQPAAAALSADTTASAYLEPAPIAAEVGGSTAPVVDAGAMVRLAGGFGAGFAVSSVRGSGDARVSAGIPHPFHFNRLRPVEGEAFGVGRSETAMHASAVYVLGLSPRADVALLGGITFFRVRQDVVTDVAFAEAYPFDTATFSSAEVVPLTASRAGYHMGIDVAWRHARRWAVGGLVRFARARIPFDVNGARAGTIDGGGLQAAAGLRLFFGGVASPR